MNKAIPSVSVVIPVYNAENSIDKLACELFNIFADMDFQLVCVDDASTDRSWEKLKKLKIQYNDNLTIVRLRKNFGQHQATLCGISHSHGEVIVTMDDDYSHQPQEAKRLLKEFLNSTVDVVYGVTSINGGPKIRKLLVGSYKLIAKLTVNGGKGSSFRVFNKSFALELTAHKSPFAFIDEFIRWHTSHISYVQVNAGQSLKTKSGYSIPKLFLLTKNIVLISSTWPLRLVTFLGSSLIIINSLLGVYFILRKLFFSVAVQGYTSLIVSILLSTGLLLFSMGIIAQYTNKILLHLYGKPGYREKEIC
jgi:polyisoprenyl-phosphate glycosyltransferase